MRPQSAASVVLRLCFLICARAYVQHATGRLPSFHALALAHGTDKVTTHRYHHMYDKYLPRYRFTPLRFLEIGLGCNMRYGPGASMAVWYEYFLHYNATIDFMETDGLCAEKFKHVSTRGELIVGDQGKEEHLERVVARAEQIGGYDVIVDDGGHKPQQQLLSFQKLWPVVNPEGIYVIEDLLSSYMEQFGGGPDGGKGTTISWIKSAAIDSVMAACGRGARSPEGCIAGLRSMECFREICVFTKAPRT